MLVKDRMSKHPLTVGTDLTLSKTHRYMQEQKVRHLPVVDKTGTMVGLVTEDDLLKAEPSSATSLSVWEIHSLLDKITTRDVMVRNVITTTEDTPIEEAAHLMLEHKIGCLPVLRDNSLVGIITESDIFRTLMELFAARQKGLRITLEVPDREGELAKVAQAIADQGGYIAACGTFMAEDSAMWGLVFKVRNVDRDALTAALSKIDGERILDIREV
ncbi:MAG TPA: CBS and ACT domain-containing protein [Anaerolineae bacterium]|nr:CBS and ACT domain-containing protein [Anaerolineae bacterium]